jgi:hypothetical protein
MNVMDQLSATERVLIARSVAHVLPDEDTPDVARLRDGVTDLDAARLILRIERGALIVPAGRSWVVLHDANRTLRLARIVEECLRLRLVYRDMIEIGPDVLRCQLAAAPVHHRTGANRTLCPMSLKYPHARYRCVGDSTLVDCLTCRALY